MEAEYNKYIVVWDNPRTIEKCKVTEITKGFARVLIERDGTAYWRRPAVVFDDRKAVDKYLEIEDYRSIH